MSSIQDNLTIPPGPCAAPGDLKRWVGIFKEAVSVSSVGCAPYNKHLHGGRHLQTMTIPPVPTHGLRLGCPASRGKAQPVGTLRDHCTPRPQLYNIPEKAELGRR